MDKKDNKSDEEEEPEGEPKKANQVAPGEEKGGPEGPGKDGKALMDKPPKPQLKEVICSYIKPNGGAQRFGGWNNRGRKHYNDLVDM